MHVWMEIQQQHDERYFWSKLVQVSALPPVGMRITFGFSEMRDGIVTEVHLNLENGYRVTVEIEDDEPGDNYEIWESLGWAPVAMVEQIMPDISGHQRNARNENHESASNAISAVPSE